jgi:hypothetical protein
MTKPTNDPAGNGAADQFTLMADDELTRLIAQALDANDPVPEHVLEGARAAFTWRTIDTELAELVFDSARELTGVRSEDTDRQVTFRAPGVEIEVMVVENGTRRLIGQLVPPSETTVELVGADAVYSSTTDRLGRFVFEELAPGPVRLVVLGADGARIVQTEWVLF